MPGSRLAPAEDECKNRPGLCAETADHRSARNSEDAGAEATSGPSRLRLELPDLQFEGHQAQQIALVEQQVELEIPATPQRNQPRKSRKK